MTSKANFRPKRPMKPVIFYLALFILNNPLVSFSTESRVNPLQIQRETVFQVSAIQALMAGIYDGVTPFQELSEKGDFGLGTLHELDGEMVALDGKFYQIRHDGLVFEIPNTQTSPFAAVTFFDSEQTISIETTSALKQVLEMLDKSIMTKNVFAAIRVEGVFQTITTRSVPRQSKPYRPLAEALKEQSLFYLTQVEGTVVGWRCPAYTQGVNVAGYHFHFLTKDKKAGGHVLDFVLQQGRVDIDYTRDFQMTLPDTLDFDQIDLSIGSSNESENPQSGIENFVNY